MKKPTLACAALIFGTGLWSVAHAQVAYTDSALNGCYAHNASTVYTGQSTPGRDVVGTLCFDGKGHILGAKGTPALSGAVGNTDGTVRNHRNQTGRYKVTNTPGDGMGVFQGRCGVHEFVLRNVDANGLAHGFSYIRTPASRAARMTHRWSRAVARSTRGR